MVAAPERGAARSAQTHCCAQHCDDQRVKHGRSQSHHESPPNTALWCQSRLAPVLTGLIRRSLSGVGWKGLGSPFRSMPLRILVVGAGVGGISVARGLLRDGHHVTVFEQRPDARAGGGAVTIWPNGATVLEQLGVDMDGAGQLLSTVRVVTSAGRPLVALDLTAIVDRLGASVRMVPRRVLLERLLAGFPTDHIQYDRRAAKVASTPDECECSVL